MISLPRHFSLNEGLIMAEWMIMDIFCVKYLTPAFITFPDFANSKLLLCMLPVLLALPMSLTVFAKET